LKRKKEKERLVSLKRIEGNKDWAFFDNQYEENLTESIISEQEKLKQLRDKTDKLIVAINRKRKRRQIPRQQKLHL
jgi:hypothetical protein